MSVSPKCDLCGTEIKHADDIFVARITNLAWWDFFDLFSRAKGDMSKLQLPSGDQTIMTSWCCVNQVEATLDKTKRDEIHEAIAEQQATLVDMRDKNLTQQQVIEVLARRIVADSDGTFDPRLHAFKSVHDVLRWALDEIDESSPV